MTLIVVYIGLHVWAIAGAVWTRRQVSKFLANHAQISNSVDLDEFKHLARRNMFLALVQLAGLIAGVLIGVVLIWRYGLVALAGVLLANGVLFAMGRLGSRLEEQVRSLPAESPELQAEHQRISESWVKKALPDF